MDYFRERLRAQREQRNWSQADTAKRMSDRGVPMHPTTIAKIEAGDRYVRIDEAAAIADLFDIPLDMLLGRNQGAESDLVRTMRVLRETAALFAYQVGSILEGLDSRWGDLMFIDFNGRKTVDTEGRRAIRALAEGRDALLRLSELELPSAPTKGHR